ncbi:alpha/beta hydrolase [Stenotrophomonas sp. STM01]|jgi:pimeloyl-ACP methyl ester carboxylesterase|uniref:alpha/beta hydrolase n=1 Tax=Stenotrophomonas sp. STM01 TaxID=2769278 RepID=UPI001CE0A6CE|nr:alpha/beta hydrolase [Stenotrophomonas sp. STM01]
MMSRTIRTTVLGMAVAGGLLGCSASPPDAAPAKGMVLGSLAFKPCSLDSTFGRASLEAQCATLQVPEDRANPQGRRIALNIAWLAPEKEGNFKPDPVLFLAGGPGQSAVDSYPMLDPAFTKVREQRNVILVDQRGTGDSNLLACTDSEGTDVSAAAMGAHAAACARTLSQKADLRHYTTTDAVADLEDVRKAIGAEQINLIGVSYGTRVAQQYAMRHPQQTRSIVLDSVVPNSQPLGNIFARNLDDALAKQFAQCTLTPSCKDALGDPRAELDALLARLRAQPVSVTYRDAATGEQKQGELNADLVAGLVRMYAYMPAAGALLPKLIHEASAGRYENLMALAQMLQSDMSQSMAMGMQLSVVCSEDADSMVATAGDEHTVLGNRMAEGLAAMCAVWPKGKAPADFHAPLATQVPALVLEGEFDPVTPPRYGEEVVKHLPNGRLFVLRGQGHNVIGAGCMPKLFTEFMDKADARALDASCLDKINYVPPFTSFNGWEP